MPRSIEARGVGLHTGAPCAARVLAASPGTGVVFRAGGTDIPARVASIDPASLRATDLRRAEARIGTVEHLLAAIAMVGVRDAIVEVDGPEVPALDGCAAKWAALLSRAWTPASPFATEVGDRLEVEAGGGRAVVVPVDEPARARYSVRLDYGEDDVGDPDASVRPFLDDLRASIAGARTFALFREVPDLVRAGLARGGSLDNALVLKKDGPLNPGGFRFPNEPARHKLLDLVGDLFLTGGLPLAEISVVRPGHALNHALARAVAAAAVVRAKGGGR